MVMGTWTRRLGRAAGFAWIVTLLAACGSDVTVTETVGGGPVDTAGTVRRGSLAVTVRAVGADASLARALGRADGTLGGATVSIARVGGSGDATATTDGSGVARFTELLPGTWQVSALRTLTAQEVATLPADDRDVTAFAGAVNATIGNGAAAMAELQAVAGRRGSLVISQVMPAVPVGPDGSYYFTGQYIRFSNNSDTTIYLDRKVVALSIPQQFITGLPASCDSLTRWRLDPEGIWATFIYAFPGTGRQYPLAPGASVTTATDAVNHAAVVPGLADLSRAEFEYIGPTDVDNPGSANMLLIGPSDPAAGLLGRGLLLSSSSPTILVLANPIDSSEYAKERIPALTAPSFWRIPRDRILDVVTTVGIPSVEANRGYPLCSPMVLPKYDRAQGGFLGPDAAIFSFSRKAFGARSGGGTVLLRTRTSAQDFERIEDSALRW